MNAEDFKGYKTDQAYIDLIKDVAIKRYYGVWENTDVDGEINMQKKFKSRHSFLPEKLTDNSYKMPRFLTSLGNFDQVYADNISKVFFSLSAENICKQLNKIGSDLKKSNLKCYDINPSNILFCSKEKLLKLIDLYWCNKIEIEHPSTILNKFYSKNDTISLRLIQKEVMCIFNILFNDKIMDIKKEFISNVGKIYNDGSFVSPGVAYQPIDIPGFDDVPCFHNNCVDEYQNIKKHIPKDITKVVDIGCSSGYFTFNLMRDFFLSSATVYETDPAVLILLNRIKDLYSLNYLNIDGRFDENVNFESDVTIWMNNYQWIDKEIGRERATQALKKVIKNSKLLFFQASGIESSGTAIVNYLRNKDQIISFLESLGGKVEFLHSTTKHGGVRHLFKVSPNKEIS